MSDTRRLLRALAVSGVLLVPSAALATPPAAPIAPVRPAPAVPAEAHGSSAELHGAGPESHGAAPKTPSIPAAHASAPAAQVSAAKSASEPHLAQKAPPARPPVVRPPATVVLTHAAAGTVVHGEPHPASELPPLAKYPGTLRAALNTLVAPLVGVAENRFDYRYKVTPYIKEVESPANGRGAVVRASRPSSLATNVTPELTKESVFTLARLTNPVAVKEGYDFLHEQGVNVVVDLRFEGDAQATRRAAEAAGLEYHNVKLKDNAWFNPQPLLVEAVNAVERAASSGKTVVVHCEAGVGRTGLVVAAHQALRRGMSEEEAIAYARSNGLELFGQEHALRVFVRNLASKAIVRHTDGSLLLKAP